MSIDIFIVLVYLAFLIVLGWMFRNASSSTSDCFMFVRNETPLSIIGLMMSTMSTMSTMFAVTMSSMDSALNRNDGIFIKDVYKPYL